MAVDQKPSVLEKCSPNIPCFFSIPHQIPPVFSIHQSVTRPLDPFWACASYLPPHLKRHQRVAEATTEATTEAIWVIWVIWVIWGVGVVWSKGSGSGRPPIATAWWGTKKVDEHRLYIDLYIGYTSVKKMWKMDESLVNGWNSHDDIRWDFVRALILIA